MHTALYRGNATLTYAASVLAVLCVLATITGAAIGRDAVRIHSQPWQVHKLPRPPKPTPCPDSQMYFTPRAHPYRAISRESTACNESMDMTGCVGVQGGESCPGARKVPGCTMRVSASPRLPCK